MSSTKQKRALPGTNSRSRDTSKMELLVKNFNGFKPLTTCTKSFI